ncbi:MAG TPA: tetratricopeptide repeat protein [Steroidobacteraceae bacterium]|nr:tetratricopeptide repeat protein [Steroidobacteraceae bacterium]
MSKEAPPGVQEVFAAALRHHQAGRLGEAEQLYRQILLIDSHHADALHFLGVLSHQAGGNESAVELIGKAIAQNGRVPAFHNNLGNALKALGRWEEAVLSYGRALTLKPDLFTAHYNIGLARQAQGNLAEAVASYGRALALKPDYVEAHGNLGNTLQAQGRLAEAVACYGRALSLEPNYAEAHSNLGNVLRAQGKPAEALASFERALALKPGLAEAHLNLGILFTEQGNLERAVACLQRALACKPDYAEAHHYLGNALREQGKLEEAVACYGRALALKPDYASARLGAAIGVIPIFANSVADSAGAVGKFSRSLDELCDWSRSGPGRLGSSVGSHQPFYLAYRPGDVGALLSRYGDLVGPESAVHWGQKIDALRSVQPRRNRIRLLVVSGHVRRHPVWDVVLRGIIAHVDRRQFEIHLYHTGSTVDEETDWARSRVDRFVQGPKSSETWLYEIAQDLPDVLFYPEVGMDPTTCALAALQLAPLQIAGWGHPVTTGLPSMNMFMSGEFLEGPGAEQHYRERLIRLPGTGVCTELAEVRAQHWKGPDRQRHVVRFALCQQPIKFDPADDVLLARIAKDGGPSEFWLASSHTHPWATAKLRDRLAGAFRTEGLDPDAYLRVMPWLPREQFAGFLDEMDVYLDCPAFSGYTTAWAAVHRGLPIVTREGEYLRQRLAAGLLRQIGITDGIAMTGDQYAQIAIRWAQECRQSDLWAARREEIRRAATKADGNRSAVRAFEQVLLNAVEN